MAWPEDEHGLAGWWRDVVTAMPLVQALRQIRKSRRQERGAVALLCGVGFYVALALLTPHWRSLQERLLASSHFRPPSMASWVLLQPAPKMYGFANRVWRGPFLLVEDSSGRVERGRFDAKSFWVNHYPARMARYDGERGRVFAKPGRTVYITIRSRYRSAELWSALEVSEHDGVLVMRSVEVTP